jgi:hypothetical protein
MRHPGQPSMLGWRAKHGSGTPPNIRTVCLDSDFKLIYGSGGWVSTVGSAIQPSGASPCLRAYCTNACVSIYADALRSSACAPDVDSIGFRRQASGDQTTKCDGVSGLRDVAPCDRSANGW